MAVAHSLETLPSYSFPSLKLWPAMLHIFYDDLMMLSDPAVDKNLLEAYHPELATWFPTLPVDFVTFADRILSSILKHIQDAAPTEIVEIMTWLTDVCTSQPKKYEYNYKE